MSAYFWLGFLLLLPSKKENINNIFVRSHAKTAVFIHFLMLLNYIFFITYSFWWSIIKYWFWLNHICASVLFLWLFWWLLVWISKANSWNYFSIWDVASITKTDKLIELKKSNLNEQWVLTIILSLIPFIWFMMRGKFKNYKSPILENNLKLNLMVSLIISLFFVYQNDGLWWLLILAYIIFVVFYSVLLITRQNLITIKLDRIKTFEDIYIYTRAMIQYFKNYFWWKKFLLLWDVLQQENTLFIEKNKSDNEFLMTLRDNKLPKYIAYIPVINIITLFDIRSKNQFHIINGLLLSIIILLCMRFRENYLILTLFPLFFSIGYIKNIETTITSSWFCKLCRFEWKCLFCR